MSIRCLLEDPEETYLERRVLFNSLNIIFRSLMSEHHTFIIAFPLGIQQMNLMRLR
jgi:hypothetical protein